MIQHLLEALTTHKAGAFSVDRIREGHVVGGHRLGNCSGSTADMEKPAGHFLSRSDFCKSPVNRLGHVDLEGLLIGLLIEVGNHALCFKGSRHRLPRQSVWRFCNKRRRRKLETSPAI